MELIIQPWGFAHTTESVQESIDRCRLDGSDWLCRHCEEKEYLACVACGFAWDLGASGVYDPWPGRVSNPNCPYPKTHAADCDCQGAGGDR